MKKNYICFCSILFIMVFGILTVSCDNGTIRVDTALNGTWKSEHLNGYDKMTFLNGLFQQSDFYNEPEREEFVYKGTYTTNDGKINFNITHLHGDFLKSSFPEINLEWYTKEELMQHAENTNNEFGFPIEQYYSPQNYSYSIDDNVLTLTFIHPTTYTKIE